MPDSEYLSRQKEFWNVPTLEKARFDRVDTRTDQTEASWQALAEADIDKVLSDITIAPGGAVLELGCGVGRLLVQARKRLPQGVRLIGVDISEAMVRFAGEATQGLPDIVLHVTDGAHLSMVASQTVDFAYSMHVFIHIADGDVTRSYLRELQRVLVPGGRLRFNVRGLNAWRDFGWSMGGIAARLSLLSGLKKSGVAVWREGDGAEFCGLRWLPRDLRRTVEEAGFSVQVLTSGPEVGELWCDAVKR